VKSVSATRLGCLALMTGALTLGVNRLADPVSATASHGATGKRVPVLGSATFVGRNGVGWGTYKPVEIFNGGDPSGMVSAISWTGWGHPTAIGFGKTYIFKPTGGYYPEPVRVELRASDLGHCSLAGPLAYRHLAAREPSHPGGALERWFAWGGAKTLCRPAF
jgi:hypothetical protein